MKVKCTTSRGGWFTKDPIRFNVPSIRFTGALSFCYVARRTLIRYLQLRKCEVFSDLLIY